MIDYNKLNKQMFNAMANNAGPEEVPEMKKVIQEYLGKFSSEIRDSILSLDNRAKKDKGVLNSLAQQEYNAINAIGANETKKLQQLINANFDSKRVSAVVQKDIQIQVSRVVRSSMPQIKRYINAVSDNTKRVDDLNAKVEKLSHGLDKANSALKNTQGKTATIICVTVVITACVCYLFL